MEVAKSSIISKIRGVGPQVSGFMHKVPGYLREVREKAYEPRIVSIGPYYAGKKEYKEMEEVKLRIFKSLIERAAIEALGAAMGAAMEAAEEERLGEYVLRVGAILDAAMEERAGDFVSRMVEVMKAEIEGEYMSRLVAEMEAAMDERAGAYVSTVAAMEERARHCYVEPIALNAADFIEMLVLDACFIIYVTSLGDSPFVCRSDDCKVRSDLALLENQIPLFVLCGVFDLIVGPNKVDQMMERVLIACGGAFDVKRLKAQAGAGKVKHILHLLHMNLSPSRNSPDDDAVSDYVVIPTAVELRGANVVFKKKDKAAPFDVEFEGGVMRMAALSFFDETESLLRNLIAYEQHLPLDQPSYVTDYTMLLDCLINSEEDVKILCRHDIIKNWLGDDQAIVDIVNRLHVNITLTSRKMFMHREIFRRVNIHRKKCWNRAEAALRRDYFNTPWALVSFLAALLLLLLTIAQTILTALQFKNSN